MYLHKYTRYQPLKFKSIIKFHFFYLLSVSNKGVWKFPPTHPHIHQGQSHCHAISISEYQTWNFIFKAGKVNFSEVFSALLKLIAQKDGSFEARNTDALKIREKRDEWIDRWMDFNTNFLVTLPSPHSLPLLPHFSTHANTKEWRHYNCKVSIYFKAWG